MTRDEIISMAREAGFHAWYSTPDREYHFGCVVKFATLVAAREREMCALILEAQDIDPSFRNRMATAIRARAEKETT